MRNDLFRDVRLREAVAMMLDFEWINANFYSGLYVRTNSFFDESEFSCAGRPASVAERELITRFPSAVREDILEGRWRPPTPTERDETENSRGARWSYSRARAIN